MYHFVVLCHDDMILEYYDNMMYTGQMYVLAPVAGAADFGPTRAPESSVKTRTERYPKISVKYIYASYPRYASTGI